MLSPSLFISDAGKRYIYGESFKCFEEKFSISLNELLNTLNNKADLTQPATYAFYAHYYFSRALDLKKYIYKIEQKWIETRRDEIKTTFLTIPALGSQIDAQFVDAQFDFIKSQDPTHKPNSLTASTSFDQSDSKKRRTSCFFLS